MKEITLVSGMKCFVDDCNYEKLNTYRWYHIKGGNTYYARRLIVKNGKNTFVNMQRDILPNAKEIDHEDRNGLNNQLHNLRECSHSDNQKNRKGYGASKYLGVSKHLNNKWLARININGKQKHIGIFNNEIDAANAYNKAVLETGNTFYNLNEL